MTRSTCRVRERVVFEITGSLTSHHFATSWLTHYYHPCFRYVQTLPHSVRKNILLRIASKLVDYQEMILAENAKDLEAAVRDQINENLISRLKLSKSKIATLADGIRQLANQDDPVGRVVRRTELSPGLVVHQVTVPLGVLLIIFESRPDALPQIASLAIYAGCGLILKGGREAVHSNTCLHRLVQEGVVEGSEGQVTGDLVNMVTSRAAVQPLLALDKHIDLVIPRGSGELVRSIQNSTKIPVLGHADGVCHVFVDEAADLTKAIKIVIDAKTDYPAACNAAETLLIHRGLINREGEFIPKLFEALVSAGITMFGGPAAMNVPAIATHMAGITTDFHHEFGTCSMNVEVVDSLDKAVEHIHAYGSGHTECIVTESKEAAVRFTQAVDSACVFHNASTRFADGYRFGLGAEVGISTSRLHARGPVGVDGLTSTKWILESTDPSTLAGAEASAEVPTCHTVSDFSKGVFKYSHKSLPTNNDQQ